MAEVPAEIPAEIPINPAKESGQTVFSDATLLMQLQAGDDASFEALFLRHYERVYQVLYRLLGNKADAEDMAQQVFLKLYRSPKRIQVGEAGTNVAGWLYRVAVNEGYNALRSRRRRAAWQERLATLWPFDRSGEDPARQVDQQNAQVMVRRILATMKPGQAKILLLRHSGLSYKEIAIALDVAPGSVGSLLTRAERAFRAKYQQAFSETEGGQNDRTQ